MNTFPIWSVAVVSGDAAGRPGLVSLLAALGPAVRLRAAVGTASDFWRLPLELLWSLDELLVHPQSLEGGTDAGLLLIAQVRRMLPRLRIRALCSPGMDVRRITAQTGDCAVNYGARLGPLIRDLDACRLSALALTLTARPRRGRRKSVPPAPQTGTALTRGEWRVLADTLAGVPVGVQAKRSGRSTKTVYALRLTGLQKLGVARVDALLLYPDVPVRGAGARIDHHSPGCGLFAD